MYPDPFNAINFRKLLEHLSQGTATIEVKSVIGCILSDDDQFLDSPIRKRGGLCNKIFDRNRLMRPPYERNGAI